ncbi:hypothetical protein GUITHDRAFT_164639 [Guillardia theta CCMP2712]|uniref:Sushi domain-containing protein n=1 Tax=Guillardia theta (strain CCMP2712) TaxID=905079 RepID=L1IWG6_GUITC|nr:hypothetical protein GUITHDRAFT_164639 [Guillardia theta CCMP2712]EKX40581.1 hypothetical protein GUITHDRAFT_164639 [Guillardia theta CCMP2712]|eukprot:XP_005827561.1 hypothetical protein GUITHDRAFT_164639 [Guillardia theta CCMP2712]
MCRESLKQMNEVDEIEHVSTSESICRYFNSSKHTLPVDYSTFDHMSPDDAPGQLRCWGMYDYGQIHPLPLPFGEASKLRRCTTSGGWLHTCGILANGTMLCWGNNANGELGTPYWNASDGITCQGQSQSDNCIVRLEGTWALTETGGVSAGRQHTCAIMCTPTSPKAVDSFTVVGAPYAMPWPSSPPETCTQGVVKCWGDDTFYQAQKGVDELFKNEQYDDFISVCTATAHSCAVRREGSLYCWGYDGNTRTTIPAAYAAQKWIAVRCKGAHTCGLTTPNAIGRSTLICWGYSGYGQTSVPYFEKQQLDRSVLTFDTGDVNTCALWQLTEAEQTCDTANSIPPALNGQCWGDGSYAQSNLPLRPLGYTAIKICDVLIWNKITAGSAHTCGITIDDPGQDCSQESRCDEYPPPLCNPTCDPRTRYPGAPIIKCPRYVKGYLIGVSPRFNPGDGNSPLCVPARTNYMRK